MLDFKARYNNGKQAKTFDVTISHMGETLWIRGDELGLESWAIGDIRVVEKQGGGKNGVVLRSRAEPEARLTLADAGALAAMEGLSGDLYKKDAEASRVIKSVALWSVLTAVAVGLLIFVAVPRLSGSIVALTPPAWEEKLGATIEGFFIDQVGGAENICRTPEAVAALNKLVAGLSKGLKSDVPRVTFLRSDFQNAIALPGGRILIFSGLFSLTDHPNAFAGVLAHEFGHIEERHPLRIAIERSVGATLISFLVGDIFGGTILALGGDFLLGAAYTRTMEREADARALELMKAAGWNSHAFAGFFANLLQEMGEPGGLNLLLSSHPPSKERLDEIRKNAYSGGGSALIDDDWNGLRSVCDT